MATSFSQAALAGLTQGGLEGVRPSRTNFEALGEDFQTYEKIGEVGDSFGGKTIIYQVYDPYGNPVGQTTVQESGLEEGLKQAAALATIPLTAGGAGGLLGGALGLSGTAASALGNALLAGGAGALTGQDPLKAALLAAGGTYVGSLFGGPGAAPQSTVTDAQFIAADAAVSGMSIPEIAQDISAGSRGGLFTDTMVGPSVPTTVTTAPSGLQTVTTTAAPTANIGNLLGGLTAAIPAAVLPPSNIVSTPLTPLDQPSQITVTGERAPEYNLGDILATIDPSLIGPGVGPQPQVIDVTGTKASTTPPEDLTAALTTTLGFDPYGPDVGPQLPANQVIEVTGTKKPSTLVEDLGATLTTTLGFDPYGPDVGPQSGGDVETQDQKDRTTSPSTLLGTLTLADILKVLAGVSSLGMLGGVGTDGTGTGTTTTLTPATPVPVGNEDYYKAVQRYYNAYMPQTPRDVATPLQQWYEGKFGG